MMEEVNVEGIEMDERTLKLMGAVLELDEMVFEIMKHFPTSDLKSCNAVNSLWRQEARKFLLKRTRVEFIGPELDTKIFAYMEEMGDQCHESVGIGKLDESRAAAEMMAIITFGNKYSKDITKLEVIIGNGEILEPFLHVSTLTLRLDGRVKIPLDFKMATVKTLRVELLHKTSNWPREPEEWTNSRILVSQSFARGLAESVLRMCPMLQNLILHGLLAPHSFLSLLRFVSYTIIPRPMITGLQLVGDDHFRYLSTLVSSLAVKLTTLEIDVDVSDIGKGYLPLPSTSLEDIFVMFAATLKHLTLHRIRFNAKGSRSILQPVKFRNMPKLESLGMTYIVMTSSPNAKVFSDVHFTLNRGTKQFPILEKLSIKQVPNCDSNVSNEMNRKPDASLSLLKMFFPKGTSLYRALKHIDIDCHPDLGSTGGAN